MVSKAKYAMAGAALGAIKSMYRRGALTNVARFATRKALSAYRMRRKVTRGSAVRDSGHRSKRFRVRRRRRLRFKDRAMFSVPPKYLVANAASAYLTTVGTQGYNAPSRMLTASTISLLFTNAGLPPANDKEYRMYLHSISREMIFKNQANVQVVVYLYYCVARKDHPLDDPVTAVTDGYRHLNDGAVTLVFDPTVVGTTPGASSDFKFRWRIVKAKKYIIDPGSIVHVNYHRPINRVFSSTRLNESISAYGGITDCLMWRQHGTPINDVAGGINTISASKILFSVVEKYKFRVIESSKSKATVAQNLSTAAVTYQSMLEDVDQTGAYAFS